MSIVTALNPQATTREIVERVNVLGRDNNGRHTAVTVAGLPGDPGFYDQWMVSDATVTTFWSVVVGGGGNTVPVRWDGTNWRIG
jgi:hypothetical protein